MSTKNVNIRIAPPHTAGTLQECIVSCGHVCPRCQGSGFFWKEDTPRDYTKHNCPTCDGAGELDAVIQIDWAPSAKD